MRLRVLLRPLKKIPGFLEAYWRLRYALGYSSPAKCWQQLSSWIKEAGIEKIKPAPGGKRILIFTDYPYWLRVCNALSVILCAKGHQVDVAWTSHGHYGPTESEESRRARLWSLARAPEVKYEGLRMLRADTIASASLNDAMLAIVEHQTHIDTQYVEVCEELERLSPTRREATFRFRYERNCDLAKRFITMVETRVYDRIIIPNGAVLEFAIAFRLARLKGIACATYEYFDRRDAIGISHNDPVAWIDPTREWEEVSSKPNCDSENNRIRKLIRSREDFGALPGGLLKIQQVNKRDSENPAEVLGLTPNKPIALLLPNVLGDSTTLGRGRCFESMAEWVRCSLDWFKERKDWQLVVRVHPSETYWFTQQPVAEVIRQHLRESSPNIFVVPADAKINTYRLFELADFGIVHNSSAGLEMAVRGKPVVVTGNAHYSKRGFTLDPHSSVEYLALLGSLCEAVRCGKAPEVNIDKAMRYFKVYYEDWPKRFPWNIATFNEDIDEWPISRVLSSEGESAFGQSFEALVNTARSASTRVSGV